MLIGKYIGMRGTVRQNHYYGLDITTETEKDAYKPGAQEKGTRKPKDLPFLPTPAQGPGALQGLWLTERTHRKVGLEGT